jgi:hypothetical protein
MIKADCCNIIECELMGNMSAMTYVRVQTVKHNYNCYRICFAVLSISVQAYFLFFLFYKKVNEIFLLKLMFSLWVRRSINLSLFSLIDSLLFLLLGEFSIKFVIFFHRIFVYYYKFNKTKYYQKFVILSYL